MSATCSAPKKSMPVCRHILTHTKSKSLMNAYRKDFLTR